MQLNDPVTGWLLRMLEGQDDSNGVMSAMYASVNLIITLPCFGYLVNFSCMRIVQNGEICNGHLMLNVIHVNVPLNVFL